MQTTTETAAPAWRGIVPANVVIDCPDHFAKVHAFARDHGRLADLRDQLQRLSRLGRSGRVRLGYDFAPYSFGFVVEIDRDGERVAAMVGGLIFHGSHDRGGDGGPPTLSVNLSPVDGWAIHT